MVGCDERRTLWDQPHRPLRHPQSRQREYRGGQQAMLHLEYAGGERVGRVAGAKPQQDDDSGGRCNARLTLRLPATGDYVIVATSRERRETGTFTLTVTAGPKPAALAPCTR